MANQTFISDFSLKKSISYYSGLIESTGSVRLFKNVWTPTNNQGFGGFDEVTFAGYSPFVLAGKSRGVVQLSVGIWELTLGQCYFFATGGPLQYAQGYYVTDSGFNVLAARKFPAPILFSGGTNLALLVKVQFRGLNIICP